MYVNDYVGLNSVTVALVWDMRVLLILALIWEGSSQAVHNG